MPAQRAEMGCGCRPRIEAWARLLPGPGCCALPCCRPRRGAFLVVDPRLLRALRARAVREGWRCPRCGAYVWHHQRGFLCRPPVGRSVNA